MEALQTKILAELPSDSLSSKHLDSLTPTYSLSGLGLLLYNGRVYVPEASDLRLQVLRNKHNPPTAGHQGFQKTLELVQREYYWPDLRTFVAEFCRTCNNRPRNKAIRHKPYGLLKQLPIPDRPWESIDGLHRGASAIFSGGLR
jgi:hypothetical protein